jgi:hypothetical protein
VVRNEMQITDKQVLGYENEPKLGERRVLIGGLIKGREYILSLCKFVDFVITK